MEINKYGFINMCYIMIKTDDSIFGSITFSLNDVFIYKIYEQGWIR